MRTTFRVALPPSSACGGHSFREESTVPVSELLYTLRQDDSETTQLRPKLARFCQEYTLHTRTRYLYMIRLDPT